MEFLSPLWVLPKLRVIPSGLCCRRQVERAVSSAGPVSNPQHPLPPVVGRAPHAEGGLHLHRYLSECAGHHPARMLQGSSSEWECDPSDLEISCPPERWPEMTAGKEKRKIKVKRNNFK